MTAERKAAAVGVSVLTHLILLWAMIPQADKPQIEAGVMSAALFDGDAIADVSPPTQTAPAKPAALRAPDPVEVTPDIEPLPTADTLGPVNVTAEPVTIGESVSVQVAAAAAAAVASDGDRCAVGAWLQAALQNDPLVEAALSGVPRSARSVANAVMVWNGQWALAAPNAAQGMAKIRAAVVAGVTSAPESCQMQPITGPVLITVGDPSNSTVLAVGSGQWRWGDLLIDSYKMQ